MTAKCVVPVLLVTFVILLAVLALAQDHDNNNWRSYYDTFNEKSLDPAKWIAYGPGCQNGGTLECVREIENGQLRLAVRNVGWDNSSDSGVTFSQSDLVFANPEVINSITTDVTLR